MSLTDSRLPPEKVSAFFSLLEQAAEKDGRAHFPVAPDRAIASYYINRAADSESCISEFDGSALASLLRARWADRPELLELIPALVDLRESVIPAAKDDDGDISPFIYEMF